MAKTASSRQYIKRKIPLRKNPKDKYVKIPRDEYIALRKDARRYIYLIDKNKHKGGLSNTPLEERRQHMARLRAIRDHKRNLEREKGSVDA